MAFEELYGKMILKDGYYFRIQTIEENEEDFLVRTSSGESFKIEGSELNVLCEDAQQQSTVAIVHHPEVLDSASNAFSNMSSINEILKNQIKKLEQNPEYIAQATAINQTVMVMIDSAKTQVEIMKLMKG